MGTRAQVRVHSTPEAHDIWLYEHYDGNYLPEEVKRALARKQRWEVPEYLARVIFSQMLLEAYPNSEDALKGELGYGIGNRRHSDIRYLVDVNVDNQWVEVDYCGGSGDKILWQGPFEGFVTLPDRDGWSP